MKFLKQFGAPPFWSLRRQLLTCTKPTVQAVPLPLPGAWRVGHAHREVVRVKQGINNHLLLSFRQIHSQEST